MRFGGAAEVGPSPLIETAVDRTPWNIMSMHRAYSDSSIKVPLICDMLSVRQHGHHHSHQ